MKSSSSKTNLDARDMGVSWESAWLLLADFGFLEDHHAMDTSESLKDGRAVMEGVTARLPPPQHRKGDDVI
jgi:hypothetical protein